MDHMRMSIGRDGQLRTSLYDKRDNFNFNITDFPFLSSNIPSSLAYDVFISQLIRYARACSSSSYECFILRAVRLSCKPLGQEYARERLKSFLRKFYGRYGDLIKHILANFWACCVGWWHPTQDCCGGHSARRPFSHTFLLFSPFRSTYARFIEQ